MFSYCAFVIKELCSFALKSHTGWQAVHHFLLLCLSHLVKPSQGAALWNRSSGGRFSSLIASFNVWNPLHRLLHSIIRVSAVSMQKSPPLFGRVFFLWGRQLNADFVIWTGSLDLRLFGSHVTLLFEHVCGYLAWFKGSVTIVWLSSAVLKLLLVS